MKKKWRPILTAALVLAVCAGLFAGCRKSEDTGVNLLLSGWTNTPTSKDDPYQKWIEDNYGVKINLNASTDFENACVIGFQSTERPDVISFPDYTTFLKFYDQGVLLEDWTPYLAKMPHFSELLAREDQAYTRQVLTKGGKLSTLWTLPDPPQWSLKIREDWAEEYRAAPAAADGYYPAGEGWQPDTPEDLLAFARWIKRAKNPNQNDLQVFGFTSGGGNTSLGTLGTWIPLMYGKVPIAPYGFYVDENNEVQFSTTDGTYQQELEFIRTLNREQLIDPLWFEQKYADNKRSKMGQIGIEWNTEMLSSATQTDYNKDKPESEKRDTTDWWKTYPVPVDETSANPYKGYLAGTGLAGRIITVSKKFAMNAEKMDKVLKLIDDCYTYYDESTDTYHRGPAYDALRWGIGIEKGVEYVDIEGYSYKYCNTSSKKGGGEKYYRELYVGAWDWGAWFSSANDGIIQGADESGASAVTPMTLKLAEHKTRTASMKAVPQIGAYLELSTVQVKEMVDAMVKFEKEYTIDGRNADKADLDKKLADFLKRWHSNDASRGLKGDAMMESALTQFKALGLAK